jgi:DNA-binding winged helix-turn-helix (wHTH) protein
MALDLSSTLEPEMATASGRVVALSSRYIRFGPFQVDQHRQEVSKNGSRLRLQGKVYQVLLALIEKQGEVVTREELRYRLWPADTHVNYDANVNTTVNKLRQALGDSSEKPLYIETIPRRGYCLVVPSEVTDTPVPVVAAATVNGSNGKPYQETHSEARRSEFWMALGVIGLILIGMLLGAGIAELWMRHFAQAGGPFPF